MKSLKERTEDALEAGFTVGALAKAAGKSSSAVSQWLAGKTRELKADSAAGLEALTGWSAAWWATGKGPKVKNSPPNLGVGIDLDQLVSQAHNYSDPLSYKLEELMGADLTQPFVLEVPDGAFGSEFPAGTLMRMDPKRPPRAGWPLLVKDSGGKLYLRDYQEAAAGRWQAVARVRGFAPLDSIDDGLEIVAVMRGVDWP